MIIYHGSKDIIEKPEFGKGNQKNDYGLGFYCTENVELAKEWIAKGAQPTETVRSLLIQTGAMEKPAKLSAPKTKGKKSNK